jgi:hypothetical protein
VHPTLVKFLFYHFGEVDQLLFGAAGKAVADYANQQRLNQLSVDAKFVSRDETLFALNGIARGQVSHSLASFAIAVKITQLGNERH